VIVVAHSNPSSDRFDERVVGPDHFALQDPDRNRGPLIVFRDPDNIRLEVWAFD
jgi:hypothetical protein